MQENLIMNKDEFDTHLYELAEMIIRQQGLQFNSHHEAQHQIQKTMARLREQLGQSNALFVEGLTYLIGKSEPRVADIARKIYAQLAVPAKVAEIIDSEIIKNPESLHLFVAAVNTFYDCGDFHVEECVMSVLLTLFPMDPQPFTCYATMLWRKHGIAEAMAFYKKIVDLFESPVLDYFAADCYFKAGDKAAAKKLLERALKNCQQLPELHEDIGQFIRILLSQF